MTTLEEVAEGICASIGATLQSEVGRGAFKVTFRITLADGTDRALKLFAQGANDRTGREIDAMARCRHPAIAQLEAVDVFHVGGLPHLYLVEEFLAGGTLAHRIASSPLSRADTLTVGGRLLAAIAHLESLQLVHRDIKPDNVMFRDGGLDAVLVDFGLVRDLARESLTPTWLMGGPGTPLYASPEQLRNEKALIGWTADQFSVGLVLAIAATGCHPFQTPNDSPAEVVRRMADREALPQASSDRLRGIRLAPLCRMLEPWPVRRYRTPGELLSQWMAL